MKDRKRIALVAHDERKADLTDWVRGNTEALSQHELVGTGTTGKILAEACGLSIQRLKSGPLGGDQQLGAMIADGRLDLLIFFWDPMTTQPHDVDVKALLRMAVLYNIPSACNRATADFMINSPLFNAPYKRLLKDYSAVLPRS